METQMAVCSRTTVSTLVFLGHALWRERWKEMHSQQGGPRNVQGVSGVEGEKSIAMDIWACAALTFGHR